MKKINDKIFIVITILIIIGSIIPLLYISRYNHSSADDYVYGILTHHAWNNSHSIIEVLRTAIEQVKITYNDWQGTFVAIFLMAIQPAIFGEQYYQITTYILLTSFIFANIYLLKVILKDCLQVSNQKFMIVLMMILLISIQFVPYPVESFYWYNGAMYYTLFYSVMLILFAVIIKLLKTDKKKQKIIYMVSAIVLAILIGGSNYTTALATTIVLVILSGILFVRKNNKKYLIVAICCVCIICLIISIIAPGNANRQSTVGKIGVIDSILFSFECSIYYFSEWTNLCTIAMYVISVHLLLSIVKKMKYSFKMPVVFTLITFCIYTAQFTPPLYAQGGDIPSRLFNIIYFSMIWFVLLNIAYWLGYIDKKYNIEIKQNNYKYLYIIFALLTIISIVATYEKMNSYIAIKSIQSGEANEFHIQMENRIKMFKNKDLKDVEVDPITVKPHLLFETELTSDSTDLFNKSTAEYFNKNSVKLKGKRVDNNE